MNSSQCFEENQMFYFLNRIVNIAINQKRQTKLLILLSTDIFLAQVVFSVSVFLSATTESFLSAYEWLTISLGITFINICCFMALGIYKNVSRYIRLDSLWTMVVAASISALILLITLLYVAPQAPIHVSLIYFSIFSIVFPASRQIVAKIIKSHVSKEAIAVAVYGAGETGRKVAHALFVSHDFKPKFFFDDDQQLHGRRVSGLPIHSLDDADKLIARHNIGIVLIAIPNLQKSKLGELSNELGKRGVIVKSLIKTIDLISGKQLTNQLKELSIYELIGREPIKPSHAMLRSTICSKIILVTGAGGSIGSELCRQIIKEKPKELLMLDISERSIYEIYEELKSDPEVSKGSTKITAIVGSILHEQLVESLFRNNEINTVFHAAAYKHVPLVEENVISGVRNNVLGTEILARASIKNKVDQFTLISTDKAVRPANVMGASKRLAELICKAYEKNEHQTIFSSVRFGNVLGSSGSVIPLFERQIKKGGPVTVTHKDVTRYFMTIQEAALLVIQATSLAKGGEVFVLDMGKSIRILDLATKLIKLRGFTPTFTLNDKDSSSIAIKFLGLRPGEKLEEELFVNQNKVATAHPMVHMETEEPVNFLDVQNILKSVEIFCDDVDDEGLRSFLQQEGVLHSEVS